MERFWNGFTFKGTGNGTGTERFPKPGRRKGSFPYPGQGTVKKSFTKIFGAWT